MRHIHDALELLTAQHDVIDFLLVQVQQTYDTDALDELADRLTAHLALEQELFYPAIASILTDDVEHELLAEHAAIKRALAELVWCGVDDRAFATYLATLAALVDGHCKYQEDGLFEAVAEAVPLDQLDELGTRLHSFDQIAA